MQTKGRLRSSGPLLAFAIALTAVLGVASSAYVYAQVNAASREHIIDRVNTVAAAFPYDDFLMLTGSSTDLGTPAYAHVKSFLTKVRAANRDARFLYLVGRNGDGQLFFYADSEDPSSGQYSPPGQIYEEASPGMYALFSDAQARTEGPDRDRWGLWVSGYAPLRGPDGYAAALLGMDLPAFPYLISTTLYSTLPLLLAIVFIVLLVSIARTRRKEMQFVEQKAEFLSIASHEIRTPLGGMRWAVESLLEDPATPAGGRQTLELVHENCVRLIALINNLLDASVIARGSAMVHAETVDLAALVHEAAAALVLPARQRGLTLDVDSSVAAAPSLQLDRTMIHRALFNLFSNAIKYADDGTTVNIAYRATPTAFELRVSDKGQPIPPEEWEQIFEGYHRTEAAQRSGVLGTGLGLSLARKAAELHGGSVRVESSDAERTIFLLSLPATRLSATPV